MITKKNWPKKIWVHKGTEYAGEFRKFCNPGKKQLYSAISETKVAFAERLIRFLKNIRYRYMQEYG